MAAGTPISESERGPGAAPGARPAPFVSIIIPVRNEEAHLGTLLDDLLQQDYPENRFEILVVDGYSSDGTVAVANRYAATSRVPIRVLMNPGCLSSSGRNVGVRHSQGELIVFIDGHCRVSSPALLANTARIMHETGSQCLCRPQPLTGPQNSWFQDVIAHARATWIGHGRDSTIYRTRDAGYVNPSSSGATYSRSVFDIVGFYDESFDACEDVEFNHRVHSAGLRSYFSSVLAVGYAPRASIGGLFHQAVRYGRGRFRLMRKHPDAASLAQLIPALFVAGLVVGGAGSWVSSAVRDVVGLALAAYGGLVAGFSVMLGVRHGWRHTLAAPVVYPAIHLGFGAGFLLEAAGVLRPGSREVRGKARAEKEKSQPALSQLKRGSPT